MAKVQSLLDTTTRESFTTNNSLFNNITTPAKSMKSAHSEIKVKRKSHYDVNVEDVKYSLSYLSGCLHATVLEDALMQLKILMECTNDIRKSKTLSDLTELRRNKYNVPPPQIKVDGIDPRKLYCVEFKMNKLENDKKLIYDYLLSFYVQLCLQSNFKSLALCVQTLAGDKKYRSDLEESVIRNKLMRRDLQKQLRQQRNHSKSRTYDINTIIESLKNDVQDSELVANIRDRYTVNWSWARIEQHLVTIKDKEDKPAENIEVLKQKYEHEQRVHTEIELITNIGINETLEKINNWMIKFDKDMEAVDLKIQKVKLEYNLTVEKRVGLEEKLKQREKLIKDWVHFKDEREKARQYDLKMTNGAIVVQAWWRGLLVRLQMGPYKPTKKGRGADKKKKK